jgi:hypothetical protein
MQDDTAAVVRTADLSHNAVGAGLQILLDLVPQRSFRDWSVMT